jgi:hypothetical protein
MAGKAAPAAVLVAMAIADTIRERDPARSRSA